MERKIIHVDMDAFYASVEQRDNPALRGKPVAVGYPERRGVVAAASYEARKFGVRSALPSVTAKRLCPELIFVPPRFEVYRAVSQQIHAIFAEYTDLVEPLALDEAYLDITENRRNIPSARQTATIIRKKIFERTGLRASAGISHNKFLAKLASDHNKPNGQFAISPEEGPAFIEALPITAFHGIGPATTKKMHELGIMTGADLKQWSLEKLKKEFGKLGIWYYDIARGHDNRLVTPDRERKSSSSETTFAEDLFDQDAIEYGIVSMVNDVWKWVEKTGMHGRTVTVKIKWSDFTRSTRSQSSANLITDYEQCKAMALALIRSVLPAEKGIRLVGVGLSNFSTHAEPPNLFDLGPIISYNGSI